MITLPEKAKHKNDEADGPSCVQIMAYMSLILVLMGLVAAVILLIGILSFPGF